MSNGVLYNIQQPKGVHQSTWHASHSTPCSTHTSTTTPTTTPTTALKPQLPLRHSPHSDATITHSSTPQRRPHHHTHTYAVHHARHARVTRTPSHRMTHIAHYCNTATQHTVHSSLHTAHRIPHTTHMLQTQPHRTHTSSALRPSSASSSSTKVSAKSSTVNDAYPCFSTRLANAPFARTTESCTLPASPRMFWK